MCMLLPYSIATRRAFLGVEGEGVRLHGYGCVERALGTLLCFVVVSVMGLVCFGVSFFLNALGLAVGDAASVSVL